MLNLIDNNGTGQADELVRISHTKKQLNASPNLIYKMHREDKLPLYKYGKSTWVRRSEFMRFIDRHRVELPKGPSRKKKAQAMETTEPKAV